MGKKVTSIAVIAAFLTASPGAAALQAVRPDVEAGVQQVREGEFERAIATLEAARGQVQASGTKPDLATVDVYLAVAYFELSRTEDARARLEEAWSAAPNLTLNATEFAPRFMTYFEQVRNEIDQRNRKSRKSKVWLVLIPIVLAGLVVGVANSKKD
jgi:hypothetical protein